VNRIRARLRPAGTNREPPAQRFSPLFSAAFGWMPLSPICLACTIPVLVVPLMALGMSLDVAYGLHALSLVTAPLVVWIIWRHSRKHGLRLAVIAGGAGAALLVAHLIGHLLVPDYVPLWSVLADRGGTALVLAATVIDAIALNRWVGGQRNRLALAAATFRLAPA
jgi:hypothetical protein